MNKSFFSHFYPTFYSVKSTILKGFIHWFLWNMILGRNQSYFKIKKSRDYLDLPQKSRIQKEWSEACYNPKYYSF